MSKHLERIKQKSISGVVSYTLRTVLLYGIAIVATGLLSAFLEPEEFGIYFIVTAAIGVLTFLSDIGLAAALIQKKDEPSLAELRTTFTVQLGLGVVILSLAWLLKDVLVSQVQLTQEGVELLLALSLGFVLASLKTIPSILMERKLDFQKLVIPQIAENVVFYGLAVWLAYEGWGVRSYTVAVIARSLVGVFVIYMLQQWKIGLGISRKALSALLKFGVKFQLNDLLARLKDDVYIVVLASVLPASQMGLLGWAKRWSMFPYQLSVTSVIAISFPTYSRLQSDTALLKKAIEKSLFFISLGIFPILTGMAVMAYPLTVVIEQYQKWQPALPALYLFCINIAWAALSTPLTNALNAIGQIDKTLKLMIMWTGLTWGLTPLFLSSMGATGVALVSAVVASTSVVTITMVKKVVPISFFPQIWRQLLASIVMGGALVLGHELWSQSLVWYIMGILAGMAIYTIVMGMIGYNVTMTQVRSLRRKK